MCHSLTELTEVPGTGMKVVHNHRSSGYRYASLTELTEVPGTGMEVLQYSQEFRVRYGSLAELAEVPGRYTIVVPVPRVLWHGRTELTEVSGTGMNIVQISQKFRVRTGMHVLKNLQKFGYGYEYRTDLTEVPGTYGYACFEELTEVRVRVIPRKIPRVWFCTYVPYRT